jgi:hypothetical protein
MSLEKAIDRLRLAEADWTEALDAHVFAEPNAGYADRLRAMATAAEEQQEAFDYAATQRLSWDPLPHEPGGRPAPYELSPDSGRVGAPELWARFDAAFADWDRSLEGTSITEIARGFGRLAATARELADAIDRERGGEASPVRRSA